MKRIISLVLALLMLLALAACAPVNVPDFEEDLPEVTSSPEETAVPEESSSPEETEPPQKLIDEFGIYTTKEDVALYIHTYGHLPHNFITKKEAQALGWQGGGLDGYAEDKCIGGTYFGNYEGLLPTAPGRKYTECDINTLGEDSRGAERIVFSNDGLIFYTNDHYKSFELLYEGDTP